MFSWGLRLTKHLVFGLRPNYVIFSSDELNKVLLSAQKQGINTDPLV